VDCQITARHQFKYNQTLTTQNMSELSRINRPTTNVTRSHWLGEYRLSLVVIVCLMLLPSSFLFGQHLTANQDLKFHQFGKIKAEGSNL